MQIFLGSLPRFTDANGDAVVGGFLYVGLPHQDPLHNKAPIYADELLQVRLPNPIRLDEYGRPVQQVFLNGAHSYRVETASKVLVESITYSLGIGASTDSGGSTTPLTDRFYIKPLSGSTIKNGSGQLGFQARRLTSTGDFLVASGEPRLYIGTTELTEANGYQTGSDGYTAYLNASNINLQATIELKDGPNGTVYDTASAVDILDGQGTDLVVGVVESSNGFGFTRAPNNGAWTPANSTVLDGIFYQGGAEIARAVVTVSLDVSTGNLTAAETTGHADVTTTFQNNGTSAPTVSFRYEKGSLRYTASETLNSVLSGSDGPPGSVQDFYQLVAPDGRELHNGKNARGGNTLSLKVFKYTSTTIAEITSGDVQIYDNLNNPLGYNPSFTSAQLNGSELFVIRDGPTGDPLDTTVLIDIIDGVASNATVGSVSPTFGLTFVKDKTGAWFPPNDSTDFICSFYQASTLIAQSRVRINRNAATGNLTTSLVTGHPDISYIPTNNNTRAVTVNFTHGPSGVKVSERVNAILDGADGDTGAPGAAGDEGPSGPSGPQGPAAPDPIVGSGGGQLTWQRIYIDGTGGNLIPSAVQTRTIRFLQSGSEIASHTFQGVANTVTETVSVTSIGSTGSATTIAISGNNSESVNVTITHTASGVQEIFSFNYIGYNIGAGK